MIKVLRYLCCGVKCFGVFIKFEKEMILKKVVKGLKFKKCGSVLV